MAGVQVKDKEAANGGPEVDLHKNGLGDDHVVLETEKADDAIPNQCLPDCELNDADSVKMIACDNPKCTREWFHIECVNLTLDSIPADPIPWFCPCCTVKAKGVINDKKKDKASVKYDLGGDPPAAFGLKHRLFPDLPPGIRSREDPASLEAIAALLPGAGGWRGRGRPTKQGEVNTELLELRKKQADMELQIAKAKLDQSRAELAGIQRSPAARNRSSQEHDMMRMKEMFQAMLAGEDSEDDDLSHSLRTSMGHSDGKVLARNKLRSGLYRKAADEVVVPQRWPHLSLRNEYRSMNMAFNELSLPLFVAGELEIISQAQDASEQTGRLQVLTSLMYDASSRNNDFSEVLKCYAAWVREIELGTYKWGDDTFVKVFDNIIKRAPVSGGKAQSGFGSGVSKYAASATYTPHRWFCTLFNRNKCEQVSPHMMQIKGYGLKEVAHICGTCYLQDKIEASHAECSAACPHHAGGAKSRD